jgi:hypothetical protein
MKQNAKKQSWATGFARMNVLRLFTTMKCWKMKILNQQKLNDTHRARRIKREESLTNETVRNQQSRRRNREIGRLTNLRAQSQGQPQKWTAWGQAKKNFENLCTIRNQRI